MKVEQSLFESFLDLSYLFHSDGSSYSLCILQGKEHLHGGTREEQSWPGKNTWVAQLYERGCPSREFDGQHLVSLLLLTQGPDNVWRLSSQLPRFSHMYTLKLEYAVGDGKACSSEETVT